MDDRTLRFRILATSDLHGHILPVDYATGVPAMTGLATLARKIRGLKDDHSVLIDLGDALQGSPLMSFHEANRKHYPNPLAQVMNYLDYDYFVPGNHDFNFGKDYLFAFQDALTAKTLCANILHADQQQPIGSEYEVVQLSGGPKIAIIGITTHYIPVWERKRNIAGLSFLDAFSETKRLVAELRSREQPDLLVVAYHGGFERDLDTFAPYIDDTGENQGAKMLQEIPGIDILLTSHQHRLIARKVNDTMVVQSGANGNWFAQIDCHFQRIDLRWQLEDITAELHDAKNETPDTNITEMLAKIALATEVFLDEPIGTVPKDDMRITDGFLARLQKHKIITLINKVQMEKTKAMISAASLGNSVTGFSRVITTRNVMSTYVFPNTLVVVEIDGKRLKQALEKNAEYFVVVDGKLESNPRFSFPKVEHYNYDMFDGIEYTIDASRAFGDRIIRLNYQGKVVQDEDIFTLALNNYRASGGGEFSMYRGLKVVKEINMDIAELLTEYIRKNKRIIVKDPDRKSVV